MTEKKEPAHPAPLAVFKGHRIRRTLYEGEWWFSVVDVVAALSESTNPRDYWFRMKSREKAESEIELSTLCRQLKLESSDGKKYETDCANAEGLFRIIQSIPSPKAEPFKRWLAKVGFERVQEIENPELAKRDHMDDFELIFSMLGERATTEIHRQEDSQGVPKLKADANAGGRIAGDARKALEKRLKRPIVSGRNYLRQSEGKKRVKD